MPVIDVHSHDVPRGWPDLGDVTGAPGPWPSLRLEGERDAMIMLGDREFRRVTDQCWDPQVRSADFTAEELGAVRSWLGGKATTIYGGSQEVQNNIISKRILGLPDPK